MQLTLVWQLYLRSYFTLHMFEFHTETNNTHATLVVSHSPQTRCIWDAYAVPKTFSQKMWNDTCAKATFCRLIHVFCAISISHVCHLSRHCRRQQVRSLNFQISSRFDSLPWPVKQYSPLIHFAYKLKDQHCELGKVWSPALSRPKLDIRF